MDVEADLVQLLRRRYGARAHSHAVIPGVRNSTGFQFRTVTRTVDALVLSLWPSKGLELIGFEMKAARSDWLRELKNPQKAEAIMAYCDRWYVVAAGDQVVRKEELPDGWGLMVATGSLFRDALKVKVHAPELAAKPLDRGFIAAILRRVVEDWVPRGDIDKLLRDAHFGLEESPGGDMVEVIEAKDVRGLLPHEKES